MQAAQPVHNPEVTTSEKSSAHSAFHRPGAARSSVRLTWTAYGARRRGATTLVALARGGEDSAPHRTSGDHAVGSCCGNMPVGSGRLTWWGQHAGVEHDRASTDAEELELLRKVGPGAVAALPVISGGKSLRWSPWPTARAGLSVTTTWRRCKNWPPRPARRWRVGLGPGR
jgi:hypothetical protein